MDYLDMLLPAQRNAFTDYNFQGVFNLTWIAALVLLVVAVILYNVQTRRLHRHPPLVALQEWLLWTAVCVFGLILVESLFHFWFITVILTWVIGIATFIWIRFFRFPPLIEAYNNQMRRARFYSQQRYKHPEETVRQRKSSTGKRRRRR